MTLMNPPAPDSSVVSPRPLPRGRAGRKDKHDRFTPLRTGRIKLGPDDFAMLRLLDHHRVATSRQLFLTVAGERNERAFLHRLQRLSEEEILARPRHQKRPGAPAKHLVYALGIEGHKALHPEQWKGAKAQPPGDWRQKDRRIQLRAIEHEVALTEVLLAFRLAAEAQEWIFRWSAGDAFRAETGFPRAVSVESEYGNGISLPCHPDAFVTLETDGHRYRFFVEVDRGTEPQLRRDLVLSSIGQKVMMYSHLREQRLRHIDHRRDSFRVVFITSTEARAHNLRAAVQQIDPRKKGSHFFLVSTQDRCTLADPDAALSDAVWWTARAGYDNPRTLFLPACARCQQLLDPANEPHQILNSAPRVVLAPASTPLADFVPDEPAYAHTDCPGLRSQS